jgi:hypothetical protein
MHGVVDSKPPHALHDYVDRDVIYKASGALQGQDMDVACRTLSFS